MCDHTGSFIEGRTLSFAKPGTVLEAESIGVKEALSWMQSREDNRVIVETDSKLTVDAINSQKQYLLEVGHIIDQCSSILHLLPETRLGLSENRPTR